MAAKIVWSTALLCCGCAPVASKPTRPTFPPLRQHVFQDAVPIVESTDDEILPTLSEHSGMIVYAAKSNGNLDIYARPLSGGAAIRLTVHSTDDTDPVF